MAVTPLNSVSGFSVGDTIVIDVIDDNGNVTANSLNSTGNVAFSGASVGLGEISNLHITGGSYGQVLTTDGAGNLSFANQGGGSTGGNIFVYTRSSGIVHIAIHFGYMTVVGRNGNISIPIQA